MHVDKKSPIPVYYQLKNLLMSKVKSGEFSEGSLIPSERDLGDSLGISRMTVRQAINQLVSDGVLYREKGRGTFVSRKKIEQRNIMSFSTTVAQRGMKASTRILKFSLEHIDGDIPELLGLGSEERVYVVKRLRLADDLPVGIEEAYLPEGFFPRLDDHDLTASMYNLIKENYGHTISYIDNAIEAAKAGKEERELLCISATIPVLKVSGVNYSKEGIKLFYEKSLYRSDEYKYNVRVYLNR